MRKHLVETSQIKPDEYRKQDFLNESEQTVTISEQAGKDTEYKAKAIYTFPISRPNQENLNGRVYNNKLWENTISRLKEVSTFGLMDHPKSEGSTKDIWCVWRNLRFNESRKLVVADAYLIGDYGKQVLEILEAGGQVGLSTSGFGDFLEDKKTINPDSYELERVADFVFNPSYEVFGSQSDLASKHEEVKKTEKVEEREEEKMEKSKQVEIKEDFSTKSLRVNMAFSFREAKKLIEAQERIDSYTDLLSYFEDGIAEDLREEIQKELDLEKEGLKQRKINENAKFIKDLEVSVSSLTETNRDLQEKLKNATDLLDSLKVYSTKLKEMYELTIAEKNGMITASDYRESQIYITSIEKNLEENKKEISGLKKELLESREGLSKRKKEARELRFINRKIQKDTEKPSELEEAEEKVEINYDNTPQEIQNYYEDLEYSTPGVIKIKEDIMRCRTLMEAQRTYLRLKSLLGEQVSVYDRKEVMNKNVYVETKQKKLPRKDGWV